MKRKAAALMTSLFVLGATVAYGAMDDDLFLDRFAKVDVTVDGRTIVDPDIPSFVVENRTVIALKSFADSVGAFIQGFDNGKVQVIKPNVNLILCTSIKESTQKSSTGTQFSLTPFSAVSRGQKISPVLYYVIDNAPQTSQLLYKIVVKDPSGRELYTVTHSSYNTEENGTDLVGILPLKEISFNQSGKYKVEFYMKMGTGGDYVKSGQTLILAK